MSSTRAPIRFVLSAVAGLTLSASAAAHAHFDLVEPAPADNSTGGGKGAPPCGPTTASNVINTDQDGKPLQGGHPLRIKISETVLHPGHYRLALGVNSRSEIPADPPVVVDASKISVSSAVQPAVFPILADGLFEHTTGKVPITFMTTITLPNIKCTKCTLQVIEFMAQHSANDGGGYFYHHCADLKFDPDPALPDGGTTDASTDTGGGTPDGGGTAGKSGAGGTTAGSGGAGGAATASGGATGSGGSVVAGTGGATGSGGASSSGGASATGGSSAGTGGAATASGGATGSGGTAAKDAGTAGGGGGGGSSGCAIADRRATRVGPVAAALFGLWLTTRRRRRQR